MFNVPVAPAQVCAHDFRNLPDEMKTYEQWVGWNFEQRSGAEPNDKPTKVPYSVRGKTRASTTDPHSWATFAEAVAAYEAGVCAGIGFVFTASDPFAGIDFDDGEGDERIKARQDKIYNAFPSYAEISPSGKGLHIIVRGSVPKGSRRDCVEVYSSERFFTMTGNVYNPSPIVDHNDSLNDLWRNMGRSVVQFDARQYFRQAEDTDEAVYNKLASQENGAKFVRLWNGDATALAGTDRTRSAVDQALANMLVWRTKDPHQIERLLLASPHGQRGKMQNRAQYRHDTIIKAFDREIPLIDISALTAAASTKPPFEGFGGASSNGFSVWPDPVPLPSGLAPVAPFLPSFLPEGLASWATDIADRMQCPRDFPAVAGMVAAGSIIGNRIGIRPKSKDSWTVVPNLWGMIVGRPGVMKSPAITEALGPLKRFEAKARKENDAEFAAFKRQMHEYRVRCSAAEKAYKNAGNATAPLELPNAPNEPAPKRRIVSDATYEALGVALGNNPNGILCYRDEVASLLKHLEREENAAARGFYLTAWNGTDSYTFDRIGRGHQHIETACLSMLGSIQPGKLATFIGRAHKGGEGDDGMSQRFNMLVWPDHSGEWKNVDRGPDASAVAHANATFDRLENMPIDQRHANYDINSNSYYLTFDEPASACFIEWLTTLERRLRSGELNASFESHLAKYRKLVPALALINHLADNGVSEIGLPALQRAIAYAAYLETHAMRAYGAGLRGDATTAQAILVRIRKNDLANGFTLRDIHQRDWSNLTDREQIQLGLDLLVDHDWLKPTLLPTGGRPKTSYAVNPKAMA